MTSESLQTDIQGGKQAYRDTSPGVMSYHLI